MVAEMGKHLFVLWMLLFPVAVAKAHHIMYDGFSSGVPNYVKGGALRP